MKNAIIKILIKILVLSLVFCTTLVVASRVMNRGHEDLTMEMASASFPVVRMVYDGVEYNTLHGYAEKRDLQDLRDTVSMMNADREISVAIDTFGNYISSLMMEVRSSDGKRLIEQTEIKDYERSGDRITATFSPKDLLEQDVEYELVLILNWNNRETYYYTRLLWDEKEPFGDELAFTKEFHEKLFDKDEARSLTTYLETNPALNDNKSFAHVDIHASFQQITYGDLRVKEITEPEISLREIDNTTATFVVESEVTSGNGQEQSLVYYRIREYFRMRWTQERILLLNYDREMEQIPNADELCVNDKVVLGIVDPDVPFLESEDGTTLAFVVANQLLCYQSTSNRLSTAFSFYDAQNHDVRTTYNAHQIKILDVDEAGSVIFAVYGYMNRGRHEGEIGVEVYSFDGSQNTIEELIYLPYARSSALLQAELDKLLYVNREQRLYLTLENQVYCVDLAAQKYEIIGDVQKQGTFLTNWDRHLMVSHNERGLMLTNLKTEDHIGVQENEGETLQALGFIGDDLVYGISKRDDYYIDKSGKTVNLMYKVCICDTTGKLLKEYEPKGYYVTSCEIEGNQMTLQRIRRTDSGVISEAVPDQITNAESDKTRKNRVVTAGIDIYETYVQLQLPSNVSTKRLKIMKPSEVVVEGGRTLQLPIDVSAEKELAAQRFFAMDAFGICGIFQNPAQALDLAYEKNGVVIREDGQVIWQKTMRALKNQIMAISARSISEEKSSLAVCMETILSYEGNTHDCSADLNRKTDVVSILQENLPEKQVLDLSGCSLDAVLNYINQDIPVMVILQDGNGVLITGYNEANLVLMDPASGTLYKNGRKDSESWFEANGNLFVTYVDAN